MVLSVSCFGICRYRGIVFDCCLENSLACPAFGGASLESAIRLLVFSKADVDDTMGDWMGAMQGVGVGRGEEEHMSWTILSLLGRSVGGAIVSLSVSNSWSRFQGACRSLLAVSLSLLPSIWTMGLCW